MADWVARLSGFGSAVLVAGAAAAVKVCFYQFLEGFPLPLFCSVLTAFLRPYRPVI